MTGPLRPARPGVPTGLSRRRVLTRTGLVVAGALGASALGGTLAGCDPSTSGGGPAGEPRPGGTLRIGQLADPRSLDPIIDPARPGIGLLGQTLDGLLNRDRTFTETGPALSGMPEQPDELTYIFPLRTDVSFHDGSPVTPDDVVFTWERLLDPDYGATSGALYQANIESVEAEGDRIVVRLKQPWPIFLSFVTAIHTKVVSKQVVQDAGDEYGNTVWSGSGPFKVDEWLRGDRVTLVNAQGNSPQGPAYLDRIEYRTIPESSARTAALLAGEIDVVYTPGFSDLGQFETDDRFQVIKAPSSTYTSVIINTRRAPFTDPRVRRALSIAIDRQALVDSFFYGYATVGGDLFPPDHWAHDPDLSVPFDPAEARRLLAEAGIDQANPLAFEMLVNNNDRVFMDQATAIQAFYEEVGVRLTLRPTEYSALVSFLVGGLAEWPAEAEMAMTELQPLRGTAYEFTYYLLGADGPFNFNGFNKPGGYQRPDVEQMMAEAAELSDYIETEREQAKPLYSQISQEILADPVELRLNWWDLVNLTSARVQNWVPANADNNLLAQVWLSE